MKPLLLGVAVVFVGCGGSDKPGKERYAVGTYLFTGSHLTGASKCTFDAPPGILDGSKILAPGTINEKCPSGYTSVITAEYADHITLEFPKTAKVGDNVDFRFTLRNAANQTLTPTLSEAGETVTLSDGCTALAAPGRGGAQDTGRDPFMSSDAVAAGTCKVTIELELPAASGAKKHRAEQDVTIK